MEKTEGKILEISRTEQYKTIDELFKRSQSNTVYYTLLILSIIIIASGLLINNASIVIGGMLVTPVLTPILVVALGLVVGEVGAIRSVAALMGKSFALVIAISAILALLFGTAESSQILENTFRAAVLYFIIAAASGAAATFAWIRKEIADVLPGIAIAVSLVPPLSLVGIWLSTLDLATARFYFLVFFSNLVGIILGSFVVFSLLKFYKAESKVLAKGKEIEKEQEKAAKEEQKEKEKEK